MIGMLLVYAGIGWSEWVYMKRRKRKGRTYFWVFFLMGFSFLYNLMLWYNKGLVPNPNRLLYPMLHALQEFLTVK